MITGIGVSPSLEPSLHLSPTLRVRGRCKSCAPGWANKFLCCTIQCCNKSSSEGRNRAIYCDKSGKCVEFDWNEADDAELRLRKTSERVAALVSSKTPLEKIYEETGVNLRERAELGQPISVNEINKIVKFLER
jgi:hypothetical protein